MYTAYVYMFCLIYIIHNYYYHICMYHISFKYTVCFVCIDIFIFIYTHVYQGYKHPQLPPIMNLWNHPINGLFRSLERVVGCI